MLKLMSAENILELKHGAQYRIGLHRPTSLGLYITSSLTGLLSVILILTLISALRCASETTFLEHLPLNKISPSTPLHLGPGDQ